MMETNSPRERELRGHGNRRYELPMHGDPNTRFWAKVEKTDGCWNWTAALSVGGYGRFNVETVFGRQRLVQAHRFSYELLIGPIPKGLQIDHLCRNRKCVNPTHLEPVTIRENILRGEGFSATNAVATHCLRGHVLAGENMRRVNGDGSRRCRQCDAIRSKAYRDRKRSFS